MLDPLGARLNTKQLIPIHAKLNLKSERTFQPQVVVEVEKNRKYPVEKANTLVSFNTFVNQTQQLKEGKCLDFWQNPVIILLI